MYSQTPTPLQQLEKHGVPISQEFEVGGVGLGGHPVSDCVPLMVQPPTNKTTKIKCIFIVVTIREAHNLN